MPHFVLEKWHSALFVLIGFQAWRRFHSSKYKPDCGLSWLASRCERPELLRFKITSHAFSRNPKWGTWLGWLPVSKHTKVLKVTVSKLFLSYCSCQWRSWGHVALCPGCHDVRQVFFCLTVCLVKGVEEFDHPYFKIQNSNRYNCTMYAGWSTFSFSYKIHITQILWYF